MRAVPYSIVQLRHVSLYKRQHLLVIITQILSDIVTLIQLS